MVWSSSAVFSAHLNQQCLSFFRGFRTVLERFMAELLVIVLDISVILVLSSLNQHYTPYLGAFNYYNNTFCKILDPHSLYADPPPLKSTTFVRKFFIVQIIAGLRIFLNKYQLYIEILTTTHIWTWVSNIFFVLSLYLSYLQICQCCSLVLPWPSSLCPH